MGKFSKKVRSIVLGVAALVLVAAMSIVSQQQANPDPAPSNPPSTWHIETTNQTIQTIGPVAETNQIDRKAGSGLDWFKQNSTYIWDDWKIR